MIRQTLEREPDIDQAEAFARGDIPLQVGERRVMSDSNARRRLLGPSDVSPQPEQSPARDRIVDPHDALEDEVFGASLRPRSFEEYVGQERVVENLRIAIDAAKRRDEPLEHVLFYGPPGLGKTTLAALIARELGANFRPTSGPTLEKPKDLVGILTSLERRRRLLRRRRFTGSDASSKSFSIPRWRTFRSTSSSIAARTRRRSSCRCNALPSSVRRRARAC